MTEVSCDFIFKELPEHDRRGLCKAVNETYASLDRLRDYRLPAPTSVAVASNIPGHPPNIPGHPPNIPGYQPNIPGHPPNIPGQPLNIPGQQPSVPVMANGNVVQKLGTFINGMNDRVNSITRTLSGTSTTDDDNVQWGDVGGAPNENVQDGENENVQDGENENVTWTKVGGYPAPKKNVRFKDTATL